MNIIKLLLLIVLNTILASVSCATEQTFLPAGDNYSVMLCGKISNRILDDIAEYKVKDQESEIVNLLILINNEDPNAITNTRVIANGKIYLKGADIVELDALFIMTLNNGIHTDTITYMAKGNKIIGGHFYNSASDTDNLREVYISPTGNVYHIDITGVSNNECLDNFK